MVTPVEQRSVVTQIPPIGKVTSLSTTREYSGEQFPVKNSVKPVITPEDSYSGTLPDGSAFSISWKIEPPHSTPGTPADLGGQFASLSFQYSYQQDVQVNGKSKKKTFLAQLHYDGDIRQSKEKKQSGQKADILSFVRRLIAEASSGISDNARTVKGVSLRKEDIAQLLGYDENKLAEKVFEIIHLAGMTKQMQRKKPDETKPDEQSSQHISGITAQTADAEKKSALTTGSHISFTLQPIEPPNGKDISDYTQAEIAELLGEILKDTK